MTRVFRSFAFAGVLAAAIGLAGCERPPMEVEQSGHRGTGMAQIDNPRLTAVLAAASQVPPPPYPYEFDPTEPRAAEVYQNVQVLGDLPASEFNRLMISITEWIVPADVRADPNSGAGCNYCHNPQNLASDEVYTKVVARRMIQMNRTINTSWQSHVGAAGVTCYTCHRGQAVPAEVWARPAPDQHEFATIGWRNGQNRPALSVAYASLPADPFSDYLLADDSIRVAGPTALASGHSASLQSTETTYGLMMHMSDALGVNCTHCHNSQNFASWSGSTPARVTAWHGIQMARAINVDYIEPLAPVFPANRLGPLGDPLKVACATCHQGQRRPLGGVSMLADHQALAGPRPLAVSAEGSAEMSGGETPASSEAVTP